MYSLELQNNHITGPLPESWGSQPWASSLLLPSSANSINCLVQCLDTTADVLLYLLQLATTLQRKRGVLFQALKLLQAA